MRRAQTGSPTTRRSVELLRRQVNGPDLGLAFLGVGLCAPGDGDVALAAMLVDAGWRQFERGGTTIYEGENRALLAEEARIRSYIGTTKFESAAAYGRSLSKNDAADPALGRLGPALPDKSKIGAV